MPGRPVTSERGARALRIAVAALSITLLGFGVAPISPVAADSPSPPPSVQPAASPIAGGLPLGSPISARPGSPSRSAGARRSPAPAGASPTAASQSLPLGRADPADQPDPGASPDGHVLRAGLRTRPRAEPVRRARPGPRRPGRGHDPRPLLPGHDRGNRQRHGPGAGPRPRSERADVGPPDRPPRPRSAVHDRWLQRHLPDRRAGPDLAVGHRLRAAGQLERRDRAPEQDHAGRRSADSIRGRPGPDPGRFETERGRHVSGDDPGARNLERGDRGQRDRPGPVPARRRPRRDAGRLAGRGAQGPGDRRPELRRGTRPRRDRRLRPVRRHPLAGLSRLAGRGHGRNERRQRDGRRRAQERLGDHQRAVPLGRWRGHREQRERVHIGDRAGRVRADQLLAGLVRPRSRRGLV